MEGLLGSPAQNKAYRGRPEEMANCTQTPRQVSVFDILLEAEQVLEKQCGVAYELGSKLVGPRPSEAKETEGNVPGLLGLATRIRRLAYNLADELPRHHEAIGG